MRESEQIELVLNVENSRVSIEELVPILQGFQGMTISMNDTLNKVYSCGFDNVSIEVLGLEHGSFKIPFNVEKFSERFIYPTLSSFVGGLLLWYFTTDNSTLNVSLPNSEIEISRDDIYKNKQTRDSVNKIATTVINSCSIQSLALKYKDEEDRTVSVTINKEQLAETISDVEDDVAIHNVPNVRLQIVSPTLEAKSVQWKVRYEGKVRAMKMNDLGFLQLIEHRDIAFSKGDFITCDIQIVETEEIDGTIKVKYAITRVRKFPHYHRVNEAEEQNINFE